jgi:hypothetical protein
LLFAHAKQKGISGGQAKIVTLGFRSCLPLSPHRRPALVDVELAHTSAYVVEQPQRLLWCWCLALTHQIPNLELALCGPLGRSLSRSLRYATTMGWHESLCESISTKTSAHQPSQVVLSFLRSILRRMVVCLASGSDVTAQRGIQVGQRAPRDGVFRRRVHGAGGESVSEYEHLPVLNW